MKAFIYFDATVGSYDIQSQLYMVTSMKGVKNVALLQKIGGGGPEYCVEIEAEDAALKDLERQLESAGGQFAGYISNVKFMAYAKA
jgi:hypothetical protein